MVSASLKNMKFLVASILRRTPQPMTGHLLAAVQEVARVLKARMGEAGKRVPTGLLPGWVIWLASHFDTSLKQIVPSLGTMPQISNEKAKCVLSLRGKVIDKPEQQN